MKQRPIYKFKECQCGCGEQIEAWDYSHCRERNFKNGHNGRGDRNNNWMGGRRISYQGYVLILKPSYYKTDQHGYVREHVFIYESYHKCCMLKWGIVHHKDENKLNNSIENLEGMTRKQHNKVHHFLER